MKQTGLVIFCLLYFLVGHSQPTSNSGLYFSIIYRRRDDSILVTEKLSDSQFDRKAAFRIDGYKIIDLGEKQYGFHKRKYHHYPCKEYNWYEENVFSL